MKKTLIFSLTLLIPLFWQSQAFCSEKGNNRLTILTYNVHHCNPPAVKGLIDAGAIAQVIISSNADIALIQEVDVRTKRVDGADLSLELSKKSGLKYSAFFKAIDLPGGDYGVTILSRYPIDSAMVHYLYQEGNSEQRVLGTAVVTLPDNFQIRLACTHLDLSAKLREIEVRQIDSVLSESAIPVILGGDFNATPNSKEIGFMLERYKSSTAEFPFTFPNKNPGKTIDYIFFGKCPDLKILSHKVIRDIDASDHLPVITEVVY